MNENTKEAIRELEGLIGDIQEDLAILEKRIIANTKAINKIVDFINTLE